MELRDSAERDRRLKAIRAVITKAHITSQTDLVERLGRRGFEVTQSSISRDLKALGVAKMGGRYVLRLPDDDLSPAEDDMARVSASVVRISPAGANLIVIHTDVGIASRVALALDRSGWTDVIGTVAGDDTVFVAVDDLRARKRLERRLRNLIEQAV